VNIDVRAGTPQDVDAVIAVLDEASAWLQSIGVTDQWPVSFSGDSALIQLVEGLIEKQEMYVACDGATVAGCFRLKQEPDATWPDEVPAAYLYSLAVKRNYAAQGVAQCMLDWATEHISMMGLSELRLDCWAGNQRLRDYYAAAGFEWRGDIEVVSSEDNATVPRQNRGAPYQVSLFARRASQDPGRA
jgi:ribosomal protein S18 acetylase RimI-like enzyme